MKNIEFEGLLQEEVDEFNSWLDGVNEKDLEEELGRMFSGELNAR